MCKVNQSSPNRERRGGFNSLVTQLVRNRGERRDERFLHTSFDDEPVVPGLVEAEVEVDRAVPVESDERTFQIVEDVEGARVQPEDIADRSDDPRGEAE